MKNSIFNYLKGLLVLSLLVNVFCLAAQNLKAIGYLPTYRFSLIEQIQLEKLTHLNIVFAEPDASGQLSTNGLDIRPIVQKAHNAGLEVFIALAGGAALLSDWEDWIAPANRSAFIHNIIEYANAHNLQGIDVDLEWGL